MEANKRSSKIQGMGVILPFPNMKNKDRYIKTVEVEGVKKNQINDIVDEIGSTYNQKSLITNYDIERDSVYRQAVENLKIEDKVEFRKTAFTMDGIEGKEGLYSIHKKSLSDKINLKDFFNEIDRIERSCYCLMEELYFVMNIKEDDICKYEDIILELDNSEDYVFMADAYDESNNKLEGYIAIYNKGKDIEVAKVAIDMLADIIEEKEEYNDMKNIYLDRKIEIRDFRHYRKIYTV